LSFLCVLDCHHLSMFGVLRASRAICFLFHVLCALSPYSTFVLVCLQGQEAVAHCWNKRNTITIKLNASFKWTRYSWNHPPLSFCHLCLVDHHCSYVFNCHHSNMFRILCASWVVLCFVCISLHPFCSCLFVGVGRRNSLIETKKHHHQHLQAQHLLQVNEIFMDSPPWSPCSIIVHFCKVDRCC
jgi:hypothetical protein